jgi:hypothetical protein
MLEVPMTPFAATIHKTSLLKVGDELADLPGHHDTLADSCILTRGKEEEEPSKPSIHGKAVVARPGIQLELQDARAP